jgi:thiol:disulfide interchange protein/DsbC/DsbD-like thiol-disulfide interchange protein
MSVRRIGILICLCLAVFIARDATAQLPASFASGAAAHTHVQLLLSANPAKPGDTILAGVDMKMDAGWHTYWKNSGAAGLPTKIEWQLPPGVTAGEIQWPLPETLPPVEVTTYGYKNEVMLLVPLTLATNLNPGPLVLKANVSWLECQEQCVPGSTNVETTLNVSSETKTSADAATIEAWKSKIPRQTSTENVSWSGAPDGDKRQLVYEWIPNSWPEGVDFFSYPSEDYEIAKIELLPNRSKSHPVIRLTIKKFGSSWPTEIHGLLINYPLADSSIDNTEVRELNLKISEPKAATNSVVQQSQAALEAPAQPLWQMLLYAFIGGLILNIMPCVLPVIALKILGFVSEAKSSPRRVRALGGIYAIGVLFSFLVLAAIVIGVKAAGHQAGWGMQFGSPIFIVCLTTLVTLVALNLFGVFEVTLSGSALDAAGGLASKRGASGAFFNGVLATALATPCTAPFLGAALGFAFAQSASIIILIFLAAGLGLSAPYVLLSWNPAWLKFLPKPGAWMEKFKIAMGFPMLATVVWLFNIATASYGKNVLWLGVFLVVIAFAAWIFGEFVQRGRKHKTAAAIVTLILLIGGYAFALEKQLDWRTAMPEDTTGSLKESADGIDWQRWSPEAVAQARADGKIILVDFTADWCLTCQVNKKTSLEIPSVRQKLKDINAVAFTGDYTRTPDNITTELKRYDRAGVPLVLVYPKGADAQPIVLPEVLTPNIVLNAFNQAAQ